ncbi:hypothetical protein F4777DRAFT_280101 [Nemania sp. FL0916]|nr:hypothetical protein F4777DRAFT_280101 [Nemania sp. FL0916]
MASVQFNTQAGDELATLFSRNMTFQQPQPVQQQSPQQQPSSPQPEPEPIKYSITQHYHHSAHTVQHEAPTPTPEPQRSFSVPPQTQPTVEQVLRNHGIDPLCLSPQQLDLFKTADTPQQLRLIQLWQICPPTNSQQTNTNVAWTNTSVENEELLAQLRHEQMLAEQEARRNSLMSLDGTPLTPVQTTEGHWVNTAYVEPYMMSGYEMLARREYMESAKQISEQPIGGGGNYRLATDPVYSHNDHDWASRQQEAMENQYGAFQQMGGMEF